MFLTNHRVTGRKSTKRILLLVLLVLLITILHIQNLREESIVHVVHRELYFLPIILAGLWFGLRGGITASLMITILYLPTVLSSPTWQITSVQKYGNLLEIILFNVVGLLVGWLRNREFQLSKEKIAAEHLAAMGQAVSCIAHDMKTPLTAIGGFIQQAKKKLATPEKAAQRLTYAQDEVGRMEAMILDMLAFAKPLEVECKDESLQDLFQETIRTVTEKARRENVSLNADTPEKKIFLCCDRYLLLEGVSNLLVNAIESTPACGVVLMRGLELNREIIIEIVDQGEGIPRQRRKEVFKPFVTTKRGGTGLGLPIVHKIATAHNGKVEIDDNPGGGAIFRIRLPSKTRQTRGLRDHLS